MTQPLNPQGRFSSAYPAPPAVHWFALFLVIFILAVAILLLIPGSRTSLFSPIFPAAWSVYLCLWIRDLNPRSRTIIFADIHLAFALIAALVSPFALPSFSSRSITFNITSPASQKQKGHRPQPASATHKRLLPETHEIHDSNPQPRTRQPKRIQSPLSRPPAR